MQNIYLCRGTLRSLGQIMSQSTSSSAFFHSSTCTCQKWKNKWDEYRSDPKVSKSYVRYECRQKRAESKKALKDLLDKTGFLNIQKEDWYQSRRVEKLCEWDEEPEDDVDGSDKKSHSKYRRSSEKVQKQRSRRKPGNQHWDDEFDNKSERIFQTEFGNKKYTWSFNSGRDSFSFENMNDFDWKEGPRRHSKHHKHEWRWSNNYETKSTNGSNEIFTIGSTSDRTLLGLAPRGPLKIDEVKNAYHECARKWHPDRHGGASKTVAEEKFKLCLNAYNSLCTALSAS